MINMFARFYEVKADDAVIGTLTDWENGRGELNANLVDAPSLRETFAPLRAAYFKAKGVDPMPEYSNVEDPAFLTA